MKILLIDHHALFREGLRHILQQLLDGAAEILEAGSFSDGLKLAGHNPDLGLVLLELNSPGSAGVISVKLFRQFYPEIPVVVVSGEEDRRIKKMAMGYGASGFVGKSSAVAALLNTLHLALSSPRDSANEDNRNDDRRLSINEFGLTARQMDVLKYMVGGLSNREIAETIDLAEGTVKLHVAAVYRALCVKNRMEVIHLSRRFGLANMSCT